MFPQVAENVGRRLDKICLRCQDTRNQFFGPQPARERSASVTSDFDFKGSVAIVTGAAGSIGAGISRQLLRAGATVIANDLPGTDLESFHAWLELEGLDPHRLLIVTGDVGLAGTVTQLLEAAERIGGCDLLVNNAAITQTYRPFLETTLEEWDQIFAVNLRAIFELSRRVAQTWVGDTRDSQARDGQAQNSQARVGSIINITSPGAQRAHFDNAIYDSAKGGLDALTRAMAVDLGGYGIRVNAIAPASIDHAHGAGQGGNGQDLPLGRSGTPEDIADAVLFLASSAAKFITGHVLTVDGGLLSQLRTRVPGHTAAKTVAHLEPAHISTGISTSIITGTGVTRE
jgi:NAD(P)-dependent dehydrogenase (short-subunit alcohol dehydrogenase family)